MVADILKLFDYTICFCFKIWFIDWWDSQWILYRPPSLKSFIKYLSLHGIGENSLIPINLWPQNLCHDPHVPPLKYIHKLINIIDTLKILKYFYTHNFHYSFIFSKKGTNIKENYSLVHMYMFFICYFYVLFERLLHGIMFFITVTSVSILQILPYPNYSTFPSLLCASKFKQ